MSFRNASILRKILLAMGVLAAASLVTTVLTLWSLSKIDVAEADMNFYSDRVRIAQQADNLLTDYARLLGIYGLSPSVEQAKTLKADVARIGKALHEQIDLLEKSGRSAEAKADAAEVRKRINNLEPHSSRRRRRWISAMKAAPSRRSKRRSICCRWRANG